MSGLLPRESPVDVSDTDPKVVSLDGERESGVFAVLSSTTARNVLARLYEEPTTSSRVAEDLDTSLQNVTYHLNNLTDAGVVEVVDQWYSEKGAEMDVFAPAGDPLVLVVGDERTAASLGTTTDAPTPDVATNVGD